MASVILLVKQTEDDEKVIYRFGPNERKMGLIEMNKIKESVRELEPVQVDGVSPSFSLTELRSDWYDVYSGKAASSRNERRLKHSFSTAKISPQPCSWVMDLFFISERFGIRNQCCYRDDIKQR